MIDGSLQVPTSSGSAPTRRQAWMWRSGWAAIVLVGLVIKALQAPLYIFGSSDDDELMVRMAQGFVHGHWSSSWSSTGIDTLVKSVGYPLFLAGAHFLPWSPLVSAYLVYLSGALLISSSWRRLSGSWPQSTVVLVLLAFNPILFTVESQRIYRDVFTCGVATLTIGLAFVIAVRIVGRRTTPGQNPPAPGADGPAHRRRADKSHARSALLPYVLALLIGLLVGVVAVTKPTWYWLPVAVVAPLAYPLVLRLRSDRRWSGIALRASLAGLVTTASVLGVIGGVEHMNGRAYGVPLVEAYSSGGWASTWKLWADVEAGPPERGVQITEAMRLAVYRISPNAAALQPFLESRSDFWKQVDCSSSLHVCTESGNWFEWDLLTAAASTGRIHSVAEAQQFFDGIAGDIERACASGELRCSSSPVLANGLPPLSRISKKTWASDTARGMWQMVHDPLPMGVPTIPPTSEDEYRLWSSVVPGMAPITSLHGGSGHPQVYSALGLIDTLYRTVNALLVAIVVLGAAIWVLARGWRRPMRAAATTHAATASFLFFCSWGVGMALLAVFEAGWGWFGYVTPLYWSDFATPAELCLAFGAIAAWPVIRDLLRRFTTRTAAESPEPVRT